MSATEPVMARMSPLRLFAFAGGLVLFTAVAAAFATAPAYPAQEEKRNRKPDLVRVNVVAEIHGAKDALSINGRIVRGYRPRIIQAFSSTGIVLDRKNHIMTFLGYRWVGVQRWGPRFEIATMDERKYQGKLIGIDQGNGVAVLQILDGNLKKTAICTGCEIKDGNTVLIPVIAGPGPPQFREAQVVSVGAYPGMPERSGWVMKINRPFPEVGHPILTADNRVLGFVANQDPMGMRTVVYPISELLSSAAKIIKTNGDIRAGWLGVFLADSSSAPGPGIVIRTVEQDSPAQKAGLIAKDRLLSYNGRNIKDVRQFIQLVQDSPVGSKARLEVERQGNLLSLTAVVEARKPQKSWEGPMFNLPAPFSLPFSRMGPAPKPANPELLMGLETIMLTPALADALQIPRQAGLLVVNVAKDMPADLAGVQVGDIIIALDGHVIRDAPGFASLLRTRGRGSQMRLKISRKGSEYTIAIQTPD